MFNFIESFTDEELEQLAQDVRETVKTDAYRIDYVYEVLWDTEDNVEPFNTFEEAKEFAVENGGKIRQIMVERNEQGEAVGHEDLGFIWPVDESVDTVVEEDLQEELPAKFDFSLDEDIGVQVIPGVSPEVSKDVVDFIHEQMKEMIEDYGYAWPVEEEVPDEFLFEFEEEFGLTEDQARIAYAYYCEKVETFAGEYAADLADRARDAARDAQFESMIPAEGTEEYDALIEAMDAYEDSLENSQEEEPKDLLDEIEVEIEDSPQD